MIYYTEQIMMSQATIDNATFGPDEEWNLFVMTTAIEAVKTIAKDIVGVDIDHTEPKLLHCIPQSHG